jgi:hypothetical protein
MEPQKIKTKYQYLLGYLKSVNDDGLLVSATGLVKLLRGESDSEVTPYEAESYFGVYRSLSRKKIKGRLHYLVQRGYILLVYEKEMDDYSLSLSTKGVTCSLLRTTNKDQNPKKMKPTIIKK